MFFAKTYFYANIKIGTLHGTWKSEEKHKEDERLTQLFINTSARDSLGNEYTMVGRIQVMHNHIGMSTPAYEKYGGGKASRGNENKGRNSYKLWLRAEKSKPKLPYIANKGFIL